MASPRYLLDTGVLMRYLRGRRDIVRFTRGLGRKKHVAVSAVSHLELFVGAHPEEEYVTRKFLSRFQTLPMDTSIGRRAGRLIRQRRAKGRTLSIPDAIIAATALHHGLTLITFNPRDFDLPGLQLYPLDMNPPILQISSVNNRLEHKQRRLPASRLADVAQITRDIERR